LQPIVGVEVQVVGEVELTRLYLGHARGHLGHRLPADLVDVRGLAAAEAVGLLVARSVLVEPHHADVLVGLPLGELEGGPSPRIRSPSPRARTSRRSPWGRSRRSCWAPPARSAR